MKDVLYHAKVGEGAFENKHSLSTIESTTLKEKLNWYQSKLGNQT